MLDNDKIRQVECPKYLRIYKCVTYHEERGSLMSIFKTEQRENVSKVVFLEAIKVKITCHCMLYKP